MGVGHESKGTMLEHGGSKGCNEGECLGVEVPEHGIGAPSANEADDIGVDTTTEHGHCAPCP